LTAHDHDHQDHDHHHDHAQAVTGDSERRVFLVMLLTGGFMAAEVVGGLLSGSLALLADAGHMLTDTASLALAWFAFRLARRPADRDRSYGYHRFQVLAAYTNGITLFFIALWIVFEAAQRLFEPVEVLGGPMLAVACVGLVVNGVAFAVLHWGDRGNLNVRGAALHVLGDLLGSAAAIAAAVVILLTGWTPIDPILSVLVVVLILRGAWGVVRESSHILLEGTPDTFDVEALRQALAEAVPAVRDVHHVHVWSLTMERPLVTLHVSMNAGADTQDTLTRVKAILRDRFDLPHATVQLEQEDCPDSADCD
jgi:cobalt-zinc-cadmium efflux system protein